MTKARDKVNTSVPSITHEKIENLKDLFPEIFTDGVIDFDKLRLLLGESVDARPERYSFSWAGKRDSIGLLQTPTHATLKPDKKESVDFDSTRNVFIEGENLEVLKLLYKSYFGQIKMIYIDPPYNTGNDFVYPDNYSEPLETYLKLTGQRSNIGDLLTNNPETSGRFHSTWLSMMYPRLALARQLLRDDGVIFVSIDDNEIYNLRMLMNEVFGEENFIECFVWKKSYGGGAKEKYAVTQHEYILLFARNLANVSELWLPPDPKAEARYYRYKDSKIETRGPYRLNPLEATKSMDKRENLIFPIPLPWGGEVWPKRQWWWSRERVFRVLAEDGLVFTKSDEGATVSYKQYLRDEEGRERRAKPFSVIDGIYTQHGTADLTSLFDGQSIIQFPKPVALIKKLLNMATEVEHGDLILDFFAGSCTTSQAVMELNREDGGNRRYICVQLPMPTPKDSPARKAKYETIADIGKERIRRVIAKMKLDDEGKLPQNRTEDLGLKIFKLDESNIQTWQINEAASLEEYVKQMKLATDPLIEGWKVEHVIWEIAIKEGYALTSSVELSKGVKSNKVYRVTDIAKEQFFLICLDNKIDLTLPVALNLTKDDLFICRDSALNDSLAANLALQCRLKTI
jgi:adenine-specific DNA-methyltransferase